MTQAIEQGETCLVFGDMAELFEAHRSSLEVNGVEHPVTRQLLGLMSIVWIDKVPLELVADIDEEASAVVIDALARCVREDPWRQAQADMMLAGLGQSGLSLAA